MKRLFVTYEDRPDCVPGLILLAASFSRYMPKSNLVIGISPNLRSIPRALSGLGGVKLVDIPRLGSTGWNVKPSLLVWALGQGVNRAIWIDSDILFSRDAVFAECPDATLVAAEEPGATPVPHEEGNAERALGLGRASTRENSRYVNSCVLSVTSSHQRLLLDWADALASDAYQAEQRKSFFDRALWAGGDQDVLNALLMSPPYASLHVELLRAGKSIAHCFNGNTISVRERMFQMLRLPPMIHAQGAKPWLRPMTLDKALSTYTRLAAQYRPYLDDESWVELRGWGKLLCALTFCHPVLAGVPIAIRDSFLKRCAWM